MLHFLLVVFFSNMAMGMHLAHPVEDMQLMQGHFECITMIKTHMLLSGLNPALF